MNPRGALTQEGMIFFLRADPALLFFRVRAPKVSLGLNPFLRRDSASCFLSSSTLMPAPDHKALCLTFSLSVPSNRRCGCSDNPTPSALRHLLAHLPYYLPRQD